MRQLRQFGVLGELEEMHDFRAESGDDSTTAFRSLANEHGFFFHAVWIDFTVATSFTVAIRDSQVPVLEVPFQRRELYGRMTALKHTISNRLRSLMLPRSSGDMRCISARGWDSIQTIASVKPTKDGSTKQYLAAKEKLLELGDCPDVEADAAVEENDRAASFENMAATVVDKFLNNSHVIFKYMDAFKEFHHQCYEMEVEVNSWFENNNKMLDNFSLQYIALHKNEQEASEPFLTWAQVFLLVRTMASFFWC